MGEQRGRRKGGGGKNEAEQATVEDHLAEMDLLLQSCSLTEAQRQEWEAVTKPLDFPSRQKPSEEQLETLKLLKCRKQKLMAELPEDCRSTLQRIMELQKKIRKTASKSEQKQSVEPSL